MEQESAGTIDLDFREIIKKFRDEELEHLNVAVENDSRKAPLQGFIKGVIQGGCSVAIWISSRI